MNNESSDSNSEVERHGERRLFLLKIPFPIFFKIAFEDSDVINPTRRQWCYKMGSVFQSDHKWNTSLFCFLGFTLTFTCMGLCGRQGLHFCKSRFNTYSLGFQIHETSSPLWMLWSVMLDVKPCCRVTWGRSPSPWDWFIYADVAYA